ncbi:hypothetical protein ANO11243_070160 [Dothideomycetidae sp. 11243]|nr:hypothetical protein ANO11243_070160 [fungal sp. No.11243]
MVAHDESPHSASDSLKYYALVLGCMILMAVWLRSCIVSETYLPLLSSYDSDDNEDDDDDNDDHGNDDHEYGVIFENVPQESVPQESSGDSLLKWQYELVVDMADNSYSLPRSEWTRRHADDASGPSSTPSTTPMDNALAELLPRVNLAVEDTDVMTWGAEEEEDDDDDGDSDRIDSATEEDYTAAGAGNIPVDEDATVLPSNSRGTGRHDSAAESHDEDGSMSPNDSRGATRGTSATNSADGDASTEPAPSRSYASSWYSRSSSRPSFPTQLELTLADLHRRMDELSAETIYLMRRIDSRTGMLGFSRLEAALLLLPDAGAGRYTVSVWALHGGLLWGVDEWEALELQRDHIRLLSVFRQRFRLLHRAVRYDRRRFPLD